MQQTGKYQFNLVDDTDDFSPAPLNQNAQKTETLLAGVEEDLAQLAAGLGAGGHNARVALGSYTGTGTHGSGSPNTLTFDFTPAVVFIGCSNTSVGWPTVLIRNAGVGHCDSGSERLTVTWLSNGVRWYTDAGHQSYQNNYSGYTYYYVALGYDEG